MWIKGPSQNLLPMNPQWTYGSTPMPWRYHLHRLKQVAQAGGGEDPLVPLRRRERRRKRNNYKLKKAMAITIGLILVCSAGYDEYIGQQT